MYKFFVAWCFLTRRVVTYLAAAAIALSVTVFIVIMAVLEGFGQRLGEQTRRANAEVQVATRRLAGVTNPGEIVRAVSALPGVKGAASYIGIGGASPVLVATTKYQHYCLLKGIGLTAEREFGGLGPYLMHSRSVGELAGESGLSREEVRGALEELVREGAAELWLEADRHRLSGRRPDEDATDAARRVFSAMTYGFRRVETLSLEANIPPWETERILGEMVERGGAVLRAGDLYFTGEAPPATAPDEVHEIYVCLMEESFFNAEHLGAMTGLPREKAQEILDGMIAGGLAERAAEKDRYVRARGARADGLAGRKSRVFALLRGERTDFRVPGGEDFPGAVIGKTIFEDLELCVGDTIFITVQENVRSSEDEGKPSRRAFAVLDTFETGHIAFDRVILIGIEEAARLYRIEGGAVTGISVWIENGDDYRTTDAMSRKIRGLEIVEFYGYEVRTWREQQRDIFEMIMVQNIAMRIILMLLLVSIIAFLFFMFWVMVTDRTRTIGVMRAVGALRSGVAGIFLSAGLILSGVGTGVGIFLGIFLADEGRLNAVARQIPFLADAMQKLFLMKTIPSAVSAWDIVLISGFTMGAAILAAGIAAVKASLVHPAEALRYE